MSQQDICIRVRPPRLHRRRETFASTGHTCPACGGSGRFVGPPREDDTTCPACGGSGKLDAVVTVEWKPSKTE